MGLIKAALGAAGSTLADQWKEFFYCDSMDNDVLVVRGKKKVSGRSSNTKGNENVITSGSGIAVADGQCMIIVDQGRIVEVCAEAGQFTYDASQEPSIFNGSLSEGILNTFDTIAKRFSMGGDSGRDQRVYYFNTKEITGNKFGTANPVPFRVVDRNIGLDIDVSLRCNGVYSFRIADPLLFYTNVCGNVQQEYTTEEISGQLKPEFISALQPAFSKISELEIRPNAIPGHVEELCEAMNGALTKKWGELRGLAVVSIAINSLTLPEEDAQMIKDAQKAAIMRDPTMAAATLVGAQAEAMKTAAANKAGAMTGFMGMGMASQAGGMNPQSLYQMGNAANQQTQAPAKAESAPVQMQAGATSWTCSCGAVNTSKFCIQCGKTKPQENGWTCSCGTVNKGKFCCECGKPKPAGEPLYRCDKCGWEPKDPHHPPKFCPECGDPFNDADIQ